MSESAGVAIATVFSILVMVAILGNSLVCLIITRNRDMRTPVNYLLLNLALADILYAVFNAPHILFVQLSLTHHPDGVTGTVLCKLITSGQIARIGAISSFVTLAAIAIERYYAVVCPLGEKGKLTKHKLKVIISGSWIFSLILNIPPFLAWKFNKESNSCVFYWPEKWMDTAYQTLKWNTLTTLTFLVMVVIYFRVVYTLWFKRNHDNQITHQQRGVIRVRKRVTLMVVTLRVIFGICWGTDQVIYSLKSSPISVAIANTTVMFNAAVNPFVYALVSQQFRGKMKRMICCTGSFARRVHPTGVPRSIEPASLSNHAIHLTGPCFQV